MPIEYEVALNKLTTPASYTPRVRSRGTVTTAELIRDISAQSTLSEADARAMLIALAERVAAELRAGNSVSIDGIVQLTPTLSAKLAGPTDPLPADATIGIGARVDVKLVNGLRSDASLTRVEAANLSPSLLTVTATTGALTALAADNILEIKGERLSFDPTQSDEGAFFVPPSGPAVRATNYLDKGDKRLRFAVPALTSGTSYTLEVRKRSKGSQTLRSGAWATSLVAA